MGELIKIKASAGAGKTHQLALRYINLLAGKYPTPEVLRSIVAITFTNKAAIEMKQRILKLLKEIYFQKSSHPKLSPKEAELWIDTILEHYSDFQVRTIDSLLFTILKALSFELQLRTEMEVVFDIERILDMAFDRMLEHLEEDKKIDLWEQLLHTFFEIDERRGFYIEKRLRRRLFDLFHLFNKHRQNVEEKIKRSTTKAELEEALKKVLTLLEAHQEGLTKRAKSWLDKMKQLDPKEAAKEVLNKKEPEKLFLKRYRERQDLQHLFSQWKELRDLALKYLLEEFYLIVGGYVRALKELRCLTDEITKEEGLVIAGEHWTELIKEELAKQEVIPLVYAYFGARFKHFLIDEFQDTSRSQWETLTPLVENALSEDGSLFYVGDPKQAIYGWRGGDWRLFEDVSKDPKLTKPSKVKERVLEYNYRSHPQLVSFFNEVFSKLQDEKLSLDMLKCAVDRTLANSSLVSHAKASQDLATVYKDVVQRSPRRDDDNTPRIFIKSFNGETKAEIEEEVKKAFLTDLEREWEKAQNQNTDTAPIAVLVRKHSQAEEVSQWILERGIPVITENSLKISNSQVVKGLINLLKYINNRTDLMALYGTLASGLWKDVIPDAATEEQLWKAWKEHLPSLKEEVDSYIESILEKASQKAPYELLWLTYEELNLEEKLNGELKEHKSFVNRLFEVAHSFEIEEGANLTRFLEYWDESAFNERLNAPENVNAVQVITIHKAKGLEYPVVFIPSTDWRIKEKVPITVHNNHLVALGKTQYLPDELREEKFSYYAKEVHESINLFYVALTRARERLYVYSTVVRSGWPPSLSTIFAKLLEEYLEGNKDQEEVELERHGT